jgi:hypothetical protein
VAYELKDFKLMENITKQSMARERCILYELAILFSSEWNSRADKEKFKKEWEALNRENRFWENVKIERHDERCNYLIE